MYDNFDTGPSTPVDVATAVVFRGNAFTVLRNQFGAEVCIVDTDKDVYVLAAPGTDNHRLAIAEAERLLGGALDEQGAAKCE